LSINSSATPNTLHLPSANGICCYACQLLSA
jgi:hypothetical protein